MNLLGRLKIKSKLALLLGLTAVSLALAMIIGASFLHTNMISDREAQTKHLVEVALGIVADWHAREKAGTLTTEQAQAGAIAALRPLRYGSGDYYFLQRYDGMTLLNVNEYWQYVARGAIILGAVLINQVLERGR